MSKNLMTVYVSNWILTISWRSARDGLAQNFSFHATSATRGRQALCHSWMQRTQVWDT